MTQIALKIPDALLADVDRMVDAGSYPNRSAAVRAALRLMVKREQAAEIDAAFATGFAAHPETADEMGDATRLAIESVEEEPWEPWW